jgi:hypothetical protein
LPSINITDQLTLNITAELAPFASWLKYAGELPGIILSGGDLSQLPLLRLSDPAVHSLQPALSFQKPVGLGAGGAQLIIGAEAGGSFQVIPRTLSQTALFPEDEYGEAIEIPAGTCYVALGFEATVNAGVTQTSGSLTFGLDAASGLRIDSYRPSSAGPDAITIAEALRRSIAEFVIPADAGDLKALPSGVIVAVTGRGSLKFSGAANLLAIANPLATLAAPSPLPSLAVTAAGSVSVGGSWEISTEYQVRAQKLDTGHVRLGWYRKRDSEFTVTATASAGISAGTGQTDLFHSVIAAISSSANADLEELQNAGLSTSQLAAIENVVESAVGRNLELAASAEFGSLNENEAAFLYDVDPAALDGSGEEALRIALAGDLGLLSGSGMPPAGITEVRSILSQIRASQVALKVNLLGIFNFASVSKLALNGAVTFAPSTGELVIADEATASRIQTLALNFGADEEKLRHVMAESFLITAAYRGSRSVVSPPELSSAHVYFRLDINSGRDDMRRAAAVASALGLGEPPIPDGIASFGRTCVSAEARYDDAAARALFLTPDGAPRDPGEYEAAGRQAIALLVLPDGGDAFRLGPATDDHLWSQMIDNGPANFNLLLPQVQADGVRPDYLAIRWWADTMHGTAEILAQMNQLAGPSGIPPGDPRFEKLRGQLASHLRDVAAKAHEQFGAPWGLVAMFLASGGKARAEMRIISSRFVFDGGALKDADVQSQAVG